MIDTPSKAPRPFAPGHASRWSSSRLSAAIAFGVCATLFAVSGFGLYLSIALAFAKMHATEVAARSVELDQLRAKQIAPRERLERSKRPVADVEQALVLAIKGDDVDIHRVLDWMEACQFEDLPTDQHQMLRSSIQQNPNYKPLDRSYLRPGRIVRQYDERMRSAYQKAAQIKLQATLERARQIKLESEERERRRQEERERQPTE